MLLIMLQTQITDRNDLVFPAAEENNSINAFVLPFSLWGFRRTVV